MTYTVRIVLSKGSLPLFGGKEVLNEIDSMSKKDSDIHRLLEAAHDYLGIIEPEATTASDIPTAVEIVDVPVRAPQMQYRYTTRDMDDAAGKAADVVKRNVISSLHAQGIDASMDGDGFIYTVDMVRDDNVDDALMPLLFRKMGGHKTDSPEIEHADNDLARERVAQAVYILDRLASHMMPQKLVQYITDHDAVVADEAETPRMVITMQGSYLDIGAGVGHWMYRLGLTGEDMRQFRTGTRHGFISGAQSKWDLVAEDTDAELPPNTHCPTCGQPEGDEHLVSPHSGRRPDDQPMISRRMTADDIPPSPITSDVDPQLIELEEDVEDDGSAQYDLDPSDG